MTDLSDLDPTHLYRNAPDLLTESAELLTASSGILTQALAGILADDEYIRDYYLRRAVQMDRIALLSTAGDREAGHAAEAAEMLAAHDRVHPYLSPAGLTVPDESATGDEARGYTRACYDAAPWS
ncbi:hypothetical protein ACFV0B_37840 [Streptomyces xanthophaeus]|uniref:hypothetical protein n=1 Tax=Streptomyces xanthophaeus TaxID=67385 RepID=UPI0036A97F3F